MRQRGLEPATGEATSKSLLGDAYQLANDAANTVTLTGKTFASSAELKDFFDDAHVENYIGEFNVTQDENHSLTAVETQDASVTDPLTDAARPADASGLDWGETSYTAFTTDVAHDALVLTKGEVKDVKGYASVDFDGETAGEKVSGEKITAAKIDDKGNTATVKTIAAVDAFTGTVKDDAVVATDITATAATATFTDFFNVTSLTAGSVAGYFSSVDFNGSETAGQKVGGAITKAEVADAKQSVTATSVMKLDGFDGTITDGAKTITATGASASMTGLFSAATITLTAGTLEGLAANTNLKTVTDGNGNSVAVTNAGKIVKAEIASLDVTVNDGNEFTLGGDKSLVKSAEQTGVTVTGDGVKATIKTGEKTVNFSSGNTGTATFTDVTKVQIADQDAVTLTTGNVAKSTNTLGTIGTGVFTLGAATDYKVTNDGTAKVGGNGAAGVFTDADSLTLTDGTASLADVADVTLDDDLAAAGNQGTVAGTLTGATKGDTSAANSVTAADAAMTLTGYTGTVTDGAATPKTITAKGASAEFTDYANVTKLTAGSVVGSFASVDFDGAASGGDPETNKVTGTITKAEIVGYSGKQVTVDGAKEFSLEKFAGYILDGEKEIETNGDAITAEFSNFETVKLTEGSISAQSCNFTSVNLNGETLTGEINYAYVSDEYKGADFTELTSDFTGVEGYGYEFGASCALTKTVTFSNGDDVFTTTLATGQFGTDGKLVMGAGDDSFSLTSEDGNIVFSDFDKIDFGAGEDYLNLKSNATFGTGTMTQEQFVEMIAGTHVEYIDASGDVEVAVDCITDWTSSANLKSALENQGIYCDSITFTHA